MAVTILKKVPVNMGGEVVHLHPGDTTDGLSDDDEAALIKGGDAELISRPKKVAKSQGSAPENKGRKG